MKLYIYPTIPAVSIDTHEAAGELLTSKDMLLSKEQEHLYKYLTKKQEDYRHHKCQKGMALYQFC
jgi:hypothetical protein